MLDAYASRPHYVKHLAPVLHALPEAERGVVYLGMNYNELADTCRRYGVQPERGRPPAIHEPVLIASGLDLPDAEGRPVIFVEHGAGQTYDTVLADHAGYTGGRGRDQVRLFLCPNEQVAAKNLARYPNAAAEVIGDPTILPVEDWGPAGTSPIVGVTFHFDLDLVPETRTTWPWWADAMLDLSSRYELIGHAHPRAQQDILPWWDRHNIMNTSEFADIAAACDLLIVDNSSVGVEFARTGRPIIWLNGPRYRRDVHHGGRFWEWTEWAVTLDEPEQLDEGVERALADPYARDRARATELIYPYIGDDAAKRAAAAIGRLA